MQVEQVAAGSQGRPASLKVCGEGNRQEAAGGVVVAVDAPAARRLLGDALADEPSHLGPGVGTCNLYFRYVPFAQLQPLLIALFLPLRTRILPVLTD